MYVGRLDAIQFQIWLLLRSCQCVYVLILNTGRTYDAYMYIMYIQCIYVHSSFALTMFKSNQIKFISSNLGHRPTIEQIGINIQNKSDNVVIITTINIRTYRLSQ